MSTAQDLGSSERHEFKTETKQLLDLMIHSLYSNRDIFLRELISNASDALDKRRFEGLTKPELAAEGELGIRLESDVEARTLTIHDNGIGMSRDEVVQNIGTIAKSGTKDFVELLRKTDAKERPELIGQFGVGFYSGFLVAHRVELVTRKAGDEGATRWTSTGDGSYSLAEAVRSEPGTSITLHLKDVDQEDGLQDYAASHVLRSIVRRYSDFVAYPITMKVQVQEPAKGADGEPLHDVAPVLRFEEQVLNSMKAIWTRSEEEVSEQEYAEFYKHIAHDWNDPLHHIATRIEGSFEARALLFIPAKAPFDLYYREMGHRGIQLYVKRVFIMDECKELMPDYLRWVKGVVDAEDLSLNVSREMLQQDRQIATIRKHLVKKVLDALSKLKADAPDDYLTFWAEFGPVLKEGLVSPVDKSDKLLELILCHSTHSEELTSLSQYVERMGEDQDTVYYFTANSLSAARNSPHLEAFRDQGTEVLLFTDHVDEVWLARNLEYQGKKLQSVGHGDIALGSSEEQKKAEEAREEKATELKDLLATLRSSLQDDVKEVRLSSRLKSSAACLVTEEGGLTPTMEKLLRQSGQPVPRVKRVLELNPEHPVVPKLKALVDKDARDPMLTEYAQLLFGQALLAEGGTLPEPAAFAKAVADLMARAS